jgi:hypothetical protein
MWAPPARTSAASEPTAIANRLISFTFHPLTTWDSRCRSSPESSLRPQMGDIAMNYRGMPNSQQATRGSYSRNSRKASFLDG